MEQSIYQVYYPDRNVTQPKVLISHDDYIKVCDMPSDTEDEQLAKDKAMNRLTNGKEWFTDKSPLFDAIETGVLNCNGTYRCLVTKS